MKSKTITINKKIIVALLLFSAFLSIIFAICMDQVENETQRTIQKISKAEVKNKITQNVQTIQTTVSKEIEEYTKISKEYKGYKVVGKIKIPKLNIEKYIIEETTEAALKVAVTKICGPKANEEGNLCIAGHNYVQTFGRLKELQIGDEIIITDTFGREVSYQIYNTFKVDSEETECLSQETKGDREITLVTCTLGAIKRNIIKAVEKYD